MADILTTDVESPKTTATSDAVEVDSACVEEIRAKEIHQRQSLLRSLRHGEEWLDAKLGVETRGIDRIPESEKRPPSMWNMFFLWWSGNVHVANLPVGMLGPQFGVSLRLSIACAILGIALGSLCTASTGILGPKLGLRQVAASRYSFGFWGAKLCSVLNVLIGGGFAVVNYVAVGQILSAVSGYRMSITVGIVIIAVLSYVVSMFGFRIIHIFEKYSWFPTSLIMAVLVGQLSKYVDTASPSKDMGLELSGACLTVLAINFALASGYCSITADYYCNYPASTPAWKVFWLTFWGNTTSLIFVISIGTCLGNAAVSGAGSNQALNSAFTNHGLGGLLITAFHPIGWAKFALVLFTFSVLGTNIVIHYSSGLSMQLLGHYFHAVPRFIWSLLFGIVVAVLAIAGQEHLSEIVEDFVALLGYWTVSFTLILLVEDKYFRRHEGYNLLFWDQPSKLPWGAAAVTALLAGYLGGGVPGMSQSWYNGPVSLKFGPHGGDCGIYLSAAMTLLVYPFLRTVERAHTGR